MSLYKKILSQAWKTTWNYKYLWFFGLFAALLGGGGEYRILLKSFSGDTGGSLFPGLQRFIETGVFSIKNIGQAAKEDPLTFITAIVVFLVILALSLFLIWLAIVAQAALVNNAAGYLANKKNDFKSGVIKGKEKFWSVLSLNIIIKAIIYVVFVLVSLPIILTVAKQGALFANTVYIVLFIIFIFIALVLSFVVKYAIAYVVIKGDNLINSIKSGWQLFINNWMISVEMAVILFLINFFVGLFIVLIVLTLSIPFFFLAALFYKIAFTAGFWLIMSLALIVFLAIIVFGGAILSTFQISSWTGLFIQLINKGGTSKIIRVIEGIKERITK